MRVIELPDDPLADRILVLFGTAAEINKWYEQHFAGDDTPLIEDEVKGHYRSLTSINQRKPKIHLVCLVKDRTYARDRKLIIAHELIHVVMNIFRAKGIPISRKNDEIFAYYHEWLTKHACKVLV